VPMIGIDGIDIAYDIIGDGRGPPSLLQAGGSPRIRPA